MSERASSAASISYVRAQKLVETLSRNESALAPNEKLALTALRAGLAESKKGAQIRLPAGWTVAALEGVKDRVAQKYATGMEPRAKDYSNVLGVPGPVRIPQISDPVRMQASVQKVADERKALSGDIRAFAQQAAGLEKVSPEALTADNLRTMARQLERFLPKIAKLAAPDVQADLKKKDGMAAGGHLTDEQQNRVLFKWATNTHLRAGRLTTDVALNAMQNVNLEIQNLQTEANQRDLNQLAR